MYKTLAQLAFDSGEIGVKEYQELMGPCKSVYCIENLCIEYKLLCCEEHPNSPNC